MARPPRITPPGVTVHVIQRGNNRQAMFRCDKDRGLFSAWLARYSRCFSVSIHACVYMPNHVHFLVTPHQVDGLPRMMQSLGRQYVRYFNKAYQRTGTLFEGRYRSCLVDSDAYLLACYRYIEMNPVRAGMAEHPRDYPWSSYGCNAGGRPSALIEPHSTYLGLAGSDERRRSAYRSLFEQPLAGETVEEIRGATNRGLPLGSEVFKQKLESSFGCKVRYCKQGRPKRTLSEK